MDRGLIYPGAIPYDTDLLNAQRNAMVGLSKLAAAILGTSTLLNGLACTPTGPASLQVNVAAGEIYSLQSLDATAYSSLAADTTHQILKQGILLDQAVLSCPAPATTGQSINYLVQVAFQENDANAVVLPYYNASNPTSAYSGPNNTGTAQNTVRKGQCIVAVKAGSAATTGSQTTPSPDAGYTGAWVVTVANGQATITSGNISLYAGAPFVTETLTQKVGLTTAQQAAYRIANAGGSSDAITASFTPSVASLTSGLPLLVRATAANTTTTPSFTPNSGTIAAKTIVKGANSPLAAADVAGSGFWMELQYDATLDKWVLKNPATGVNTISPKAAAKAWVQWAGATGTIASASNVSSVTRTGTGTYTVSYTSAMADANYAFQSNCVPATGTQSAVMNALTNTPPTTSNIQLTCYINTGTPSLIDPLSATLTVHGN